jgi:hypothetical protein
MAKKRRDKRIISAVFPTAGLLRRAAARQQHPYTTQDTKNCRPFDTIEGRERGGSRPGLGKASYDELGSGAAVNMLESVRVTATGDWRTWSDHFGDSELDSVWSTASWIGTAPGILPSAMANALYDETVGAVRSAISNIDVAQAYVVEMFIVPYQGQHHGKYQLFARMDDTTPDASTGGIVAELVMTGTGGTYSGSLTVDGGTPIAFSTASTGAPEAGWFSVTINGNDVTCHWLGIELASETVAAATGKRWGFGMDCTVGGGICLTDSVRIQYHSTDLSETTRRLLVAASNGTVSYEDAYGHFAAGTGCTVAADRLLHGTERVQKLYIADNSDPRVDTDSVVVAADGVTLTKAAVNWATLGVDATNDVVVVTAGTGSVVNGTYTIASVVTTTLTLATTTGGSGTCSVHIQRGPKVFHPTTHATTLWTATTAGDVPTGCRIVCLYRDRIVLAGADESPHLWYMSRSGDPYDWDADTPDTDDYERPFYAAAEVAGIVGEPVSALIPHTDDFLVFGCLSSLWVLRGDPAYGGQLDNLSREIGVLMDSAWCRGPSGEVYFLGRDGLYVMPPGANTAPASLGRERLPQEMRDINTAQYSVFLAYDMETRGVHIYVV